MWFVGMLVGSVRVSIPAVFELNDEEALGEVLHVSNVNEEYFPELIASHLLLFLSAISCHNFTYFLQTHSLSIDH